MRADDLIAFIKEREAIRIAKEAGQPRPWTSDAILNTYRFCKASGAVAVNDCVVIKANVRTILAAERLSLTDHNSGQDFLLLHSLAGLSNLD